MKLPIKTERLVITKLALNDLPAYEALISIPVIAEGAGFNLVSNQKMLGEIAKRQLAHPNSVGIWLDHQLVGAILLYERIEQTGEPDTHNLELSYFLHPDFWNQGLMTEAMSGLIEALKRDHTVQSLSAEVFIDNLPSKGLIQKVGFQELATVTDPLVGKEKVLYQLKLQ
ncbi:GNAT family N-acetyltransferase [Lentilactobacillus otakiensis]|uniref:GNAT family N-acetyltransferase n=1 Tax=Lentilactobacillus otakiensis TaxID=481720 RepID=UPI003D17C190